jgi:D-proline reductase (dithiol) PrdB
MGQMSEFTLGVRAMLKLYRWRTIDPVPWALPDKPLEQCRVGLVSSAALVLPDQKPFDEGIKGGDWSFREIASDVDPQTLIEAHRSESFDRSGLVIDKNLVFPLDRLREMEREGAIGSFNRRALSFMGSITAPGRLIRETAPRAAELFVEDEVDVVLLVPV